MKARIVATRTARVYCGNEAGRDVYVDIVEGEPVPGKHEQRLCSAGFARTEGTAGKPAGSGKAASISSTSEVSDHGKG